MKLTMTPPGGHELRGVASPGDGFELKPLVTRDEELFIEGGLNAAEYFSRVAAEESGGPWRSRGYQRVEFALSAALAVAGVAFFVAATTLLSSGGDHALVGLLASILTMLAVQVVVELRRRARHKARG